MLNQKQIHIELARHLEKVAESYFDNRVDYYKPRYIDLQLKFVVDPATNEIIQYFTSGCKIPYRYIGEPQQMTRDELLDEAMEEKKDVSL